MSEYMQYLEAFKADLEGFCNEDAEACPCKGSGWVSSEVDTSHRCPYHWNGQSHPEEDDLYLTLEEEAKWRWENRVPEASAPEPMPEWDEVPF